MMETFTEITRQDLKLIYDIQDLFGYHMYYKGKNKDINILGYNIQKQVVHGLHIWSKKGDTHPTLDGLKFLYYDGNKLRTKLYPDKEIHIISLTFMTLKQLWDTEEFKNIFSFIR